MGTLDRHFKITAGREYEKNPKLSPADVRELLDWADGNVAVHGKMNDLQVIMFLHSCDYDKEYAKRVMRQCYTLRANKCAPYFSARDPAHQFIQRQLDVININFVPDENTGHTYIWTQLKIFDASQYYPTIASKINFMAIELDQNEFGTNSGYRMVLDSNNFGLSHALRYSLAYARHLMTYVQEGTPFVIEKIYILNVTLGTERLYAMMKSFMNSSLQNKITLRTVAKTGDFIKTLPQKVVPEDYGGLACRMNEATETLKKRLLDNRDYFLDEEKFRNGFIKSEVDPKANEIKKDEMPSFKSLSID